jgi:hypothetical protein
MLAAEQDQTEQELPKSICQPRHVRLFWWLTPARCNTLKWVRPFPENSRAGRLCGSAEAKLDEWNSRSLALAVKRNRWFIF